MLIEQLNAEQVRNTKWNKIGQSLGKELQMIQDQLKAIYPHLPYELRKQQVYHLDDCILSFRFELQQDRLVINCNLKYADKQQKVRFCRFQYQLNNKYMPGIYSHLSSNDIIWQGYSIATPWISQQVIHDKNVVDQTGLHGTKNYSDVPDVVKKQIIKKEDLLLGVIQSCIQEHKASLDQIAQALYQSRELLKNKALIEKTKPLFETLYNECLYG